MCWRNNIYSKIQLLCSEKKSLIFTRQEFGDRFLDDLKKEYPQNNTVDSSINRTLQELRDSKQLEFISYGKYRFIKSDSVSDQQSHKVHAEENKLSVDNDYASIITFSINNIVEDGCFINREYLI